MSTLPRTDFGNSAKRHITDAELLHEHSRPVNASHLAGLAAECGLKALIATVLGGHVNENGLVVHPDTGKPIKDHVDRLWRQVSVLARNRTANTLLPLLMSEPFANWNVAERYCDGTHLAPAVVASHLSAARSVVMMLDQARNDGMLI